MRSIALDKYIYYYEDIFFNIDSFLHTIKSNDFNWEEWSSSNSSNRYGDIIGGANPLPAPVYNELKSVVMQCLYDYCLRTNQEIGFVPEFYTIQKYDVGAYMGPHVDSTDMTEQKSPTISIVVYLNDDYQGGEIEFPNQGITLKPKAGSMVIFPSYDPYLHDPKPVISGDKYMSPVFCFKEPF